MNSAIEVRGLSKQYPGVLAVNNINFQVEQGEICPVDFNLEAVAKFYEKRS